MLLIAAALAGRKARDPETGAEIWIDGARDKRDAARRLTRRTRVAAAFLGLVALVAAGAGVYAMRAQNEAEKQATIAGQQRTKAEKEADRAHAAARFPCPAPSPTRRGFDGNARFDR